MLKLWPTLWQHIKVHKKQQSIDGKQDSIKKTSLKQSNDSLNSEDLIITESNSDQSLQTVPVSVRISFWLIFGRNKNFTSSLKILNWVKVNVSLFWFQSRSHINVIQSATGSTTDKNLIFIKQFSNNRSDEKQKNMNLSIDESIISNNSNTDSHIEYVDFAAINLLTNSSTSQQSF